VKKSGRHGGFDVHGGFAECLPAGHSAKSFYFFLKKYFAECLPEGHSAKKIFFFKKGFAECGALSKEMNYFLKNGFAECQSRGTRQSDLKMFFFVFHQYKRDQSHIYHINHV
jgi:hypothetical protein